MRSKFVGLRKNYVRCFDNIDTPIIWLLCRIISPDTHRNGHRLLRLFLRNRRAEFVRGRIGFVRRIPPWHASSLQSASDGLHIRLATDISRSAAPA